MHDSKRGKFSRRWFLCGLAFGLPVTALADAFWLEPDWFRVRTVRLHSGKPAHRFVHFSDLHYKGDRRYVEGVVRRINALSPEFVCFTGDIIEKTKYLPSALELLQGVKSPLFGVPGNHDYWSHADFNVIGKAFAATGGRWLTDENIAVADGAVQLWGLSCMRTPNVNPQPGTKNIALLHYPAWIEKLTDHRFDLALAGHSHGGQVRLPFLGALVLPAKVGRYDWGLFHTRSCPLYVNAGIGWFHMDVRFNCRPEITVFEI